MANDLSAASHAITGNTLVPKLVALLEDFTQDWDHEFEGSMNRDTNIPLIPRKILFENPNAFSPRISPDGRWLSWIAGFDGDVAALKALKDGVFDVTATQQTQGMGRLAVDSAIKIVAGEKLPAEQLQDATLTTKDNFAQFIEKHP